MEYGRSSEWNGRSSSILATYTQTCNKLRSRHNAIDQGWPTSQMLRVTFLSVFQRRALSYTRDNDHITILLIDTHTFPELNK